MSTTVPSTNDFSHSARATVSWNEIGSFHFGVSSCGNRIRIQSKHREYSKEIIVEVFTCKGWTALHNVWCEGGFIKTYDEALAEAKAVAEFLVPNMNLLRETCEADKTQ